jgi:hypothetical protein
MRINIHNTTEYDEIKFYVCYGLNSGEYYCLETNFYKIKNNNTYIDLDTSDDIETIKVYIRHNGSGYRYKFKYYSRIGNVIDINLKMRDGEKHPELNVSYSAKPDKIENWSNPKNKTFLNGPNGPSLY